jgi:hypothetical protein
LSVSSLLGAQASCLQACDEHAHVFAPIGAQAGKDACAPSYTQLQFAIVDNLFLSFHCNLVLLVGDLYRRCSIAWKAVTDKQCSKQTAYGADALESESPACDCTLAGTDSLQGGGCGRAPKSVRAISLDQLSDDEESCFLGGLCQSPIETDERAMARLLLAPD